MSSWNYPSSSYYPVAPSGIPATPVKYTQVLNDVLQKRRYKKFEWINTTVSGPEGRALHQATFMFEKQPLYTSSYHPTAKAAREEAAMYALPIVRASLGV